MCIVIIEKTVGGKIRLAAVLPEMESDSCECACGG